MDEEHRLLESMVHEFVQKEIQPVSRDIELRGIPEVLIRKLADQGFMGAIVPGSAGGSEMDMTGYSILLREMARESPSVAFYIMMQNTFGANVVMKEPGLESLVSEIASGRVNASFYLPDLVGFVNSGKLSIRDNRITGVLNAYINSGADAFIVPVAGEGYFLVREGFTQGEHSEQLGLRGMSMAPVEFNSSLDNCQRIEAHRNSIIESSYLPLAAIATGIALGGLAKAMSYADQREAFHHRLKDFQAIAFGLSRASSQVDMIDRHLLYLSSMERNARRELMLKISALDIALEVSKLALQVHGGYGYLLDFGVEKYYRDAMFIAAVTGNYSAEREKLSTLIFESRAGWI
ncbi:MAG: acyl-CoA dehydrogenase family protein [Candidatus Thermoplasmatota archaeon]|nr:acyl-CoA dehydrogenase family protein [Candidatus Thermoplasmatota archaeon]MCL5881112.1 acyl-CoA dehydrogenase family protein [Candidatus Thermoplasmatota archaeon]